MLCLLCAQVPDSLPFGCVPAIETAERELVISNTGDTQLSFTWKVEAPFRVEPPAGQLQAGAQLACKVSSHSHSWQCQQLLQATSPSRLAMQWTCMQPLQLSLAAVMQLQPCAIVSGNQHMHHLLQRKGLLCLVPCGPCHQPAAATDLLVCPLQVFFTPMEAATFTAYAACTCSYGEQLLVQAGSTAGAPST